MKTLKLLVAVVLVILLVNPGFAQEEEDNQKRKKYKLGTHHDFSIDLGINNWVQDGEFPNDNNELYAVRPWGSWYVALNSVNDTHITGPLHVEWGLGVSWYNFKFENEATRIEEGNNTVLFSEASPEINSDKSKLTASYLNASLVPVLRLGGGKHRNHHSWRHWHGSKHEDGLRIGAGIYAGYKLASYTKTIIEDDKNRDHDGYFLENVRYGARFQMGFRGIDIFANYDLNEMFVKNKGPELNAFSFGVIL